MSAPRAKTWVEEHFPGAVGYAKAALILAFGAGVDAGLAEGQEIVAEILGEAMKQVRRAAVDQDMSATRPL